MGGNAYSGFINHIQKLIAIIDAEIDGNTVMLRSDEPKTEKRIAVLHARIEMLVWVKRLLQENVLEASTP